MMPNVAMTHALPFDEPSLRPPTRQRFAPVLVREKSGEQVSIQDGRQLHLRTIRPQDVEGAQRFFQRLSPQDVRRRFLHAISEMPTPMAQRLCRIDPTIETALVLVDVTVVPGEIRGVGRIYVDEASDSAEFALVVEKDWTRLGLGALLMQRLVDDCRRRGLAEIWGYVLLENRSMLDLCKTLGFVRRRMHDEPGIAQIVLRLA